MTALLNILPQAQVDLLSHVDYLANRSPDIATRFNNAVNDIYDQLLQHPQLGECYKVPSPSGANVRFLTIAGYSNYVLFYREQDSRIDILRLLHGSQDWQRALFR